MSKLDDLIKEYCPNGVEYKKISELAEYEQPTKYIVKSTNYNDDYEIPVLTAGQSFILGYTNEENGIYKASKEQPVIIFDDFTAAFKWVDFPFKVKSSAMKMITAKGDAVLIRYLYHYMGALSCSSTEHTRLWIRTYSEFTIPVPPLPVQREIVRILDNFTEFTAELTAELTMRKKQYEYYRDELLKPSSDTTMVRLGDFATVTRGGNFQKKDFKDDGEYPCIHYGQMYTHYGTYANNVLKYLNNESFDSSKKAVTNDIVMAVTSENVEDVCSCTAWLGKETIAVSGHTAIIHHEQNAKYLSYYFRTQHFFNQKAKLAHGTKVIEVTPSSLLDCIIPLPSIDEQNRIVAILDRFDALCNDISFGLPAEIEARQKQYEYYRDKLLVKSIFVCKFPLGIHTGYAANNAACS